MFRTEAIRDALWPEGLGVGTYAVAQLAAASVDATMREQGTYEYPVAQTAVTVGCLAGGILGIGYNRAPDFCTGLVYGAGVGLVINAIRTLWEAARKEPMRTRLSDVAALIPRRVGATSAIAGLTGGGLRLEAGRRIEVGGVAQGAVVARGSV